MGLESEEIRALYARASEIERSAPAGPPISRPSAKPIPVRKARLYGTLIGVGATIGAALGAVVTALLLR